VSEAKPASDLLSRLSEPFEPSEVKFKPAVVSGNRAMALAYVDARVVQDRLDDALGVEGWQDDYECREDGSVICRLRCLIGGEWIQKVDVGGPSEQPDGGDRLKAAFSDALKRAAVKFGVGRYLYRVPNQWVDYDAQKRQFTRPPVMPAAFLPGRRPAPVGNEALVRALCAKAAALRAAKNLTGVLGLAITGAGFTLAAGREVPRSTDAALALFADWAESDLRQIDRWLDGQLQDAPGPAGAGRAGLVRQIDAEIRKRRGATWIGLLRYYEVRGADGQPLPFTWPEPGTPDEAAAEVGRLPVTEETLRRMLGEFAPKGKPAPGAQPQPAA
jgi:hypothetical protein